MFVGCPLSSVWKRKNSHSGPTSKVYPIFAALFNTFFRTYRLSPSKGTPSGRYTSHIKRATFPCCGRHGRISNVLRSGYRYISDSSIRTKPSIAEPSNIHLLSNALSSWLAVIATFFKFPDTSVNWSLINCTSFSSTSWIISCFV